MAKKVSDAVKEFNAKHNKEIEQISLFDLFDLENIVIEVRLKNGK